MIRRPRRAASQPDPIQSRRSLRVEWCILILMGVESGPILFCLSFRTRPSG